MTELEWNNLQKLLFAEYFTLENGSTIETVQKNARPIKEIWKKLYILLQNHLENFDKDSCILKVKRQTTQRKNLLIFKVMPFEYFVIDMDEERTLNNEEVEKLLDEDYFIYALDEDKNVNLKNVEFYQIENQIVKKIMDLFYENSTIYLYGPNINVKISDGYNKSIINIKLDTGKVTLSFIGEDKNVNYIFLNENLTPIGKSNPTNNIEDLKNIANRIKTIRVPESIIPKFIFKNDVLTLKKINKND